MPTILDHNGQPIQMAAIREPQSARVAHLQGEFDEHPARGLTPARLARIMVDAEEGDLVPQLELADDMEERDGHLYAELSKRRGALTLLDWSIEPPDNATPDEMRITEQVRDWVGMITAHANGVDGGMELVLATMTDAILKGYSPQEMVWQPQADAHGRQVLVPSITAQPQRWFTSSGDRRRFLLRANTTTAKPGETPRQGEELIPVAWLMHVHPARNGYLARMSLARVLFWPYLFKNFAVRDLAEFLEIYGLPLRLGKYPTGASDAEKRTLLQAVTAIGHNAAGIIPAGMALEFQAAAAGTEVPFAAMWDRMDAVQSKAILGQTLSASEGRNGTQALGKVHEQVRMDIRNADARLIEGTITRQLIHPLVALNVPGANPRRLPRLSLDTGEGDDLEVYANNLPKLAAAGLRIPVQWAQDKLRIPEPAEGEAVLQGTAAPAAGAPGAPGEPATGRAAPPQPPKAPKAPATPPSANPPEPAQLRAALAAAILAGTGQPPRDAIDELVDEQAAQWQPVLAPLVAPLLAELDKAVAAGESLAAFAARLPQLVEQMDNEPLAERVARAAFSAHLAGAADLDLTGEDA